MASLCGAMALGVDRIEGDSVTPWGVHAACRWVAVRSIRFGPRGEVLLSAGWNLWRPRATASNAIQRQQRGMGELAIVVRGSRGQPVDRLGRDRDLAPKASASSRRHAPGAPQNRVMACWRIARFDLVGTAPDSRA